MNAAVRADHSPRLRDLRSGFTLIELLVVLALVALISVIMFGGLRFGVRAWEVGDYRIDRINRIQSVQNLLRRELSTVSLPRLIATDERRGAVSDFTGTSSTLTFVAPLPARDAGGLYLFTLAAHRTGGLNQFILDWGRFRSDSTDGETVDTQRKELLLDGIAGIEMAYYGSVDPERLPPKWTSEWIPNLGLPQLIRVRVAFPPGDPRQWPDLIVAPRLYVAPF
jgi:general secretion pathway protein J